MSMRKVELPILSAAVVDAEADAEAILDIGDGKGQLLAGMEDAYLKVFITTITGTPDFTIDSIDVSFDGTNFHTLFSSLSLQVNPSAQTDTYYDLKKLSGKFPPGIRELRFGCTVASLTGANFGTVTAEIVGAIND